MQKSITQSLIGKKPDKKLAVKEESLGNNRDEKPLIPVELDITRTKEFWENAVPS